MKRDYSVRIPSNEKRIAILEENNIGKRRLSRIKDYCHRPTDTDLKDFHPGEICIRLRDFFENDNIPSSLVIIKTKQTASGYTDEKKELGKGTTKEMEKLSKEKGYEKWGAISTTTDEYRSSVPEGKSKVLLQDLDPIGKFIKIESQAQEGLYKTLALLEAKKDERISKKAAVLLGEHLNVI